MHAKIARTFLKKEKVTIKRPIMKPKSSREDKQTDQWNGAENHTNWPADAWTWYATKVARQKNVRKDQLFNKRTSKAIVQIEKAELNLYHLLMGNSLASFPPPFFCFLKQTEVIKCMFKCNLLKWVFHI